MAVVPQVAFVVKVTALKSLASKVARPCVLTVIADAVDEEKARYSVADIQDDWRPKTAFSNFVPSVNVAATTRS